MSPSLPFFFMPLPFHYFSCHFPPAFPFLIFLFRRNLTSMDTFLLLFSLFFPSSFNLLILRQPLSSFKETFPFSYLPFSFSMFPSPFLFPSSFFFIFFLYLFLILHFNQPSLFLLPFPFFLSYSSNCLYSPHPSFFLIINFDHCRLVQLINWKFTVLFN